MRPPFAFSHRPMNASLRPPPYASAVSNTLMPAPGARSAAPPGLPPPLGAGFGLAVIIGSPIGIGILRTPGLVAGQLGSPAAILAAWIAGGLYTLVGAVC